MRLHFLLSLAMLFAAASAQTLEFVNWPSAISDMAFNVTLSYSGFTAVDKGMIVSLNTAIGDYLADGKISLGTAGSGTGVVYITPPLGFVTDNIGLNVTLRAFVIRYTDILNNVSTAYTYALQDQNLTNVPVSERADYGSAGKLKFMGVNIGGGENYAKYDSASTLYFKQVGFNTFGLFTSWKRMVPDPVSGAFKTAEVVALTNAVNYITQKIGAFCVLELHNYGRYGDEGLGDVLGSGNATEANFASVWYKLALLYKNNSRVIFSLMNEPHDQNNAAYISALQAAVSAIRSGGAGNMIMIQGNRWNSAMNWLNVDSQGPANTETLVKVKDPMNNMIFNIHQWLDATHGGSDDGCISADIGALYLSGVTLWLRNNNKKAYLGDFGATNDEICQSAIDDLLTYLEANSDVWVGWSWWNGGAYLSDTGYTIQPTVDEEYNTIPDPKQAWLVPHFSAKCPTYFSTSSTPKTSSCLLLNGLEGPIAADANSTAPTDETGNDGTSGGNTNNPGKKITLKPANAAVSSVVNQQVLALLVSLLMVVSLAL